MNEDEKVDPAKPADDGKPDPSKPVKPGEEAKPEPAPSRKIELTDLEYRSLFAERERRLELEREKQAQVDQAEADRARALAEKGQFADALKQHQDKSRKEMERVAAERDALQRRYHDREKAAAANDATAGLQFLSEHAARQARQILESRFEVLMDRETGDVQVVDRVSRRPAADVAREWLGSVEAAHFLAPKVKGGSPAGMGSTQADAAVEPDPSNLSFEQMAILNWKRSQADQAANGWQLPIQSQARHRGQAK